MPFCINTGSVMLVLFYTTVVSHRTGRGAAFNQNRSLNILAKFKKEKNKGLRVAALGEFLDVPQFQVGDEEKQEHHGGQSHVVLPQAPGGGLYSQVVKVLLSCAPGTHMHSHLIKESRSQFLF